MPILKNSKNPHINRHQLWPIRDQSCIMTYFFLEKKVPLLELVRVKYFLAFSWKSWNCKNQGNHRKMVKNADINMSSIFCLIPVRLLCSAVGRAIGLKISFPLEVWVRASLGEKTFLLLLSHRYNSKSDNGALVN